MFGDELRFGRAFDPWRELTRLQDEVNRVFTGTLEARTGWTPALNVWTSDDGAVLRATLPGYDPAKIDISVLGDSVTITGKREPSEPRKDVTYHRRERELGGFSRTMQLPFRIEADEVKADFKNGILELRLPRAHADRPRRIAVKAD
jgi:HSP20 family protein